MSSKNSYQLHISGADETIKALCDMAIKERYGDSLPKNLSERLERELSAISINNYSTHYLLAHDMVKTSLEKGYRVSARSGLGSLFTSYLLGLTEICPDASVGGIDMMPEVFMGSDLSREPEIVLNFAPEVLPDVIAMLKERFGEKNVIGAGITVVDSSGNVKIGVHSSGIFIVPEDVDIQTITDLREDERDDGIRLMVTERHYKDVEKYMFKYNLCSKPELGNLHDLEARTGISIDSIPMDDTTVANVVERVGDCFYEKDYFASVAFDVVKPHSFVDIVKLLGLTHMSLLTENDDGKRMRYIKSANKYGITCRDDIMDCLIQAGFDIDTSYKIMLHFIRGKGMTEEIQQILFNQGISRNLVELLGQIGYVFHRSQVASYALLDWRMMYYYYLETNKRG
jgi:DNA polymerase-3 subunit alpha (Gram-positive type)